MTNPGAHALKVGDFVTHVTNGLEGRITAIEYDEDSGKPAILQVDLVDHGRGKVIGTGCWCTCHIEKV